MNTNLNKVASDLYKILDPRFTDVKMGDENANVLSKKTDIPNARFFEFEYKHDGVPLGTIAITLDEDDGVLVELVGDLATDNHPSVFKFIRNLRQFSKNRLLNFKIDRVGKDNLTKRDYEFKAKPKEEPVMPQEPMMESKMYGTSRLSYQDLGEARLVIKHSQPVNLDLAAGRTMHIESIYVENADGERFKYPFKHLNGARALAEHLKHGGNPYDPIGKHITSLSEELAQLRKFKGYVGRNETLGEAMGDITTKVMERIEEVKKEIQFLQRPAYYEQFAESFEDREEQLIPEEIMSDWIDRLTIRTFNEELKTAFPYIFRLVDESEIPVKELSPDDLLDETIDYKHLATQGVMHPIWARDKDVDKDSDYYAPGTGKMCTGKCIHNDGKEVHMRQHGTGTIHKFKVKDSSSIDEAGSPAQQAAIAIAKKKEKKIKEEDRFESFLDRILGEDEESQEGRNTLFSKNIEVRGHALQNLKDILAPGLPAGQGGLTASQSLKGIIDSDTFTKEYLSRLSGDDDAGIAVKMYLGDLADDEIHEPLAPHASEIAKELIAANELNFDHESETPVGGEEVPPEAAAPTAPPPEAAPAPAPDMTAGVPPAGAVPPAPDMTAGVPPAGAVPPAPVAESTDDLPWDTDGEEEKHQFKKPHNPNRTGRDTAKALSHAGLLKAIHKAKEAGAKLDTKLDFGHKEMTLHDCIRECGMDPAEFGFEQSHDPVNDILKAIAGFWNKQNKNFTIGGTRAKIKVLKDFKNGEFKGAEPHHVKHVIALIDKMDPSSHNQHELGHIKKLAGMNGQPPSMEIDMGEQQGEFNVDQLLQQLTALSQHPDQIPAAMDAISKKAPELAKNGIGQVLQKTANDAPNQTVSMPGVQMNPQDMMKGILSKFNDIQGQKP